MTQPHKPSPKKPGPIDKGMAYGYVPPQAVELEQAVLGAIMLKRDKLDEVVRILKTPETFYTDANQKVYEAILDLIQRGEMVDLLTVTNRLRIRGNLEIVGGAHYVMGLTMNVVSAAHVETHARLVMEKFMQREIIRISGEAIQRAYNDDKDAFENLEIAQYQLGAITDHIRSGTIKSIGQSLTATVQEMYTASLNPSDMLGLPTGISKFDLVTLGLTAPDLIVLAGGTGEGKTTLALNIAEHIAQTTGPIGFFSLEMKDRQLIWKILSGRIREQIKDIRKGNFSQEKWNQLNREVVPALKKLGIYMYDVGGLNIVELKAIARTMKKKHGIKALFIDYIQLVRAAGKRFGSREEEVNYVSKELKALAMELEVPIIALSQLSRLEKGTKRMYRLSDLRESGAIEQDADGVVFVYRPTVHDQVEMNIDGQHCRFTETDALIVIEKWRLGETANILVRFDGAFNKFSDHDPLAGAWPSPEPEPFPAYSAAINAAGSTAIDITQPRSVQQEDLPF